MNDEQVLTGCEAYRIGVVASVPFEAGWDDEPWAEASTAELLWIHRRSNPIFRPRVEVKVLHDGEALSVFFRVEDQYVLSRHMNLNGPVCRDSCVEFFVRPREDRGYFNFEINAGGTLHVSYIQDPTRDVEGFRVWEPVQHQVASMVRIESSMPRRIWPEITEPVTWTMKYRVPRAFFEHYTGALGEWSGQTWRANFYKCADDSSHPHWMSWNPVGDPLSFHRPERFGVLELA